MSHPVAGPATARGPVGDPAPENRARLFVALGLPDRVRVALAAWVRGLPAKVTSALRPVAPDALHVTLCFLGSQPEHAISAIAAACNVVVGMPAPQLGVGEALWLPSRRPRVLALELDEKRGEGATAARRGQSALGSIQGALSEALAAGGWYEPETRPYLAHVTVARVRGGGSSELGGVKTRARGGGPGDGLPPPPELAFSAAHVVLYRSRLLRTGARYEALAEIALASTA